MRYGGHPLRGQASEKPWDGSPLPTWMATAPDGHGSSAPVKVFTIQLGGVSVTEVDYEAVLCAIPVRRRRPRSTAAYAFT